MVEKAKDAYKAACDAVASFMNSCGYSSAQKSHNQLFDKQTADVACNIRLQTLSKNESGVHVNLSVWAKVGSLQRKAFLESQARTLEEPHIWLGGGLLCQLFDPREGPSDWNVASPAHRQHALPDVQKWIKNRAFRYFDQFQDVNTLAKQLESGDIPCMPSDAAFEFLLAHGKTDSAIKHARWRINMDKRNLQEFSAALAKFKAKGVPNKLSDSSYGTSFAARSILYGIDLL